MKDHSPDHPIPGFSQRATRASLPALSTALLLSLAGCGGGSSGTGATVNTPTPPQNNSPTPTHQVVTLDSPSGTAWTWVSGADTAGAAGVYGSQGVAAAGNIPGGRWGSGSWTDAAGNFWLFGGWDGQGYLNDLWMYSPTSGEWTWLGGAETRNSAGVYGTQGSAAASNMPGARSGESIWVDPSGNVWMFGGEGYDSAGHFGIFDDFWKYSPTTGQWTWVSGSDVGAEPGVNPASAINGVYGTLGVPAAGNQPGARGSAGAWTDSSGNLWLFGGDGYGASGELVDLLNDMWEYNPGTGLWTWKGGSNSTYAAAIYGQQGMAAASNVPGARNASTSWTDASGNFWLFGGYGNATSNSGPNSAGDLNDLWEFSPSTGLWTWVAGTDTVDSMGVYGAANTPAAGNVPSGRAGAAGWVDASGNIWIFGGGGNDNYAAGDEGPLSDLWKYSPATGLWAWVSGSNKFNAMGVYGTQGVAATTNLPGARSTAGNWIDASGRLWLFGGGGNAAASNGALNDLWMYQP